MSDNKLILIAILTIQTQRIISKIFRSILKRKLGWTLQSNWEGILVNKIRVQDPKSLTLNEFYESADVVFNEEYNILTHLTSSIFKFKTTWIVS